MRTALLISALAFAILIALYDMNSPRNVVNIGYFGLVASMLLAAALWKSEEPGNQCYRDMQRIYAALANEPMSMEALMKKLIEDASSIDAEERYQTVIGRMLTYRQLEMQNGLATIA